MSARKAPPTPSTPTAPLQPFPEPPSAPVTPVPVVAIAPTTPAEPTPDQPIACDVASAAGNTQVLMGPMTQQQTMVWQQAIVQKQLQAAQQIKPKATIILPGPVPLPIPAPITTGPKPILVDLTDPRGPTYTPNPTLPTFPISTPPISILPIVVGIINICIPRVVVYPPGKEELCKQLQKDVDNEKESVSALGKCLPEMTNSELQKRADAFLKLASARDVINSTCFNVGNTGHTGAATEARNGAAKCMKYMNQRGR